VPTGERGGKEGRGSEGKVGEKRKRCGKETRPPNSHFWLRH